MTFNVRTNTSALRPGFDHPAVVTSATQELSPDRRYLLMGRDYQKVNSNVQSKQNPLTSTRSSICSIDLQTQHCGTLRNLGLADERSDQCVATPFVAGRMGTDWQFAGICSRQQHFLQGKCKQRSGSNNHRRPREYLQRCLRLGVRRGSVFAENGIVVLARRHTTGLRALRRCSRAHDANTNLWSARCIPVSGRDCHSVSEDWIAESTCAIVFGWFENAGQREQSGEIRNTGSG